MIREAEIEEVVAATPLLAVEEKMRHAEIDRREIATGEDIVLIRTIEEREEAGTEVAVDHEALRKLVCFASEVFHRVKRRGAVPLLGEEVATQSHHKGGRRARLKETVPPNQLSSDRSIKTHTNRPKWIGTNQKNEAQIATPKARDLSKISKDTNAMQRAKCSNSSSWRLRCHKTVLMQMLRPQQVKQMCWHHRQLAHGSAAKNRG